MVTLRTALTPVPQRGDGREDFSDEADAYAASMVLDAAQANAQIGEANAFALRAEAAAASALNAPGTLASSTSNLTIGAGAKNFTIQSGKALQGGMWLLLSATGAPTTWMAGPISSYNSGTGATTIQVVNFSGSGSASAWTVSVIPPINLVEATKEQIWAGATGGLAITAAALKAAEAEVALDFASSLVLNGATFSTSAVTVTSNFTLAAPANLVPGRTYRTRLTIGGSGSYAWAVSTSGWKWPGRNIPALSTAAGAVDELIFQALTASSASARLSRDVG